MRNYATLSSVKSLTCIKYLTCLMTGFLIRRWCCLSSSAHKSEYQENHFVLSFSVWHKTSTGVRKTYSRVLYFSGLDWKLMLLNFVIPVTLVKSPVNQTEGFQFSRNQLSALLLPVLVLCQEQSLVTSTSSLWSLLQPVSLKQFRCAH